MSASLRAPPTVPAHDSTRLTSQKSTKNRLAGFAALAALIPTYSCNFTGDQLCPTISAGKAAAALGAFEWLAFSATLGLTIWNIVQNRRTGGGDGDVEAPGVAQPQYNMQAPYEQGQVLQQPQPQPVMYQQGPQY